MVKGRRPRFRIRPELLIIAVLIVCDLHMMNYDMNSRMSGNLILDTDGELAICHRRDSHEHDDERILWKFDAQTCRFIEVLDEELHPVFRMIYADIPLGSDPLERYLDQLDVDTKDEAHVITVDTDDGDRSEVHSAWFRNDQTGRDYLIIHSVSRRATISWTFYTITGYLILILCLVLAVNSIYWQCAGTIRKYKRYKKALEEDY